MDRKAPGTLDDAERVVEHVAQVVVQLGIGSGCLGAAEQRLEHPDERLRRALEVDDLAGEREDTPGDAFVAVEELLLDLVDVVLEAQDDWRVAVDDLVEDRVQHRFGSHREELGGGCLEPAPHGGEVGRLRMPEGHDEVGAHEDVELADLDLFGRLEVARRPQHDEQGVVVAFELCPLVARERIFHRERVQSEFGCHGAHFFGSRAVPPAPGHPAKILHDLVGLRPAGRFFSASSADVHGVVDQAMVFTSIARVEAMPEGAGASRSGGARTHARTAPPPRSRTISASRCRPPEASRWRGDYDSTSRSPAFLGVVGGRMGLVNHRSVAAESQLSASDRARTGRRTCEMQLSGHVGTPLARRAHNAMCVEHLRSGVPPSSRSLRRIRRAFSGGFVPQSSAASLREMLPFASTWFRII